MTGSTHRRRSRAAAGLAALLIAAASLGAAATESGATPTARPGNDGGWTTVQPSGAGLDQHALDTAFAEAFTSERNTQGVVVVRNGRLAAEQYAPGEGPNSWAASWSMAKSVTSILVGIAIDQGKIASVNESMATWIPEWEGTPKAAITLKDVLQMQTGLKSNEDYDPNHATESDVIQMGLTPDQLAYSIARPLQVTPGTRFRYSSADAMLLSAVIQKATGMTADEFAEVNLFKPLGITQVEWWRDAKGHTLTYCCMDTTTRNFARIGLLYLHDGNWEGHQIVSAQWVHDSLTPASDSQGQYGYQWWISSLPGVEGPIYKMQGFDGQFVFAIPSLDLVVARNGTYTKSSCPAVADPNLFSLYPPLGLIPGAGTSPPVGWNTTAFLTSFTKAVTGPSPQPAVFPTPQPDPGTRDPDGQAMVPCKPHNTAPTTTSVPGAIGPPGVVRPAAPTAVAVRVTPAFTG